MNSPRGFINCFVVFGFLIVSAAMGQEGSHTEITYALNGLDPVALSRGEREQGAIDHRVDYEGYHYLFATEAHRSTFKENPDNFAVQDKGNCPVAKVLMNKNVKGKPDLFSMHRGKIYLFANQDAKKTFDNDPSRFITSEKEKAAPREGSGF